MRSIVFALALLLAACSGTTTGQLTDAERGQMKPVHHVFAARLDYNRILTQVAAYSLQPACSEVVVIACSDGVVVKTSLSYLVEADKALDTAEMIVRGGGTVPEDLLGNSRRALAALSVYLVAKEVVK